MIEVGDARHLPLKDNSVHLLVTSPPYNVDIAYNLYDDNLSFEEYEKFTRDWISEGKRVLVPGGRMCINISNPGRRPYYAYNRLVVNVALELNLLHRGEIIWYKGSAISRTKTSWGSYMECTCPVLRDCHEYIEVFSKDSYFLDCKGFIEHDITKKQFSDYTVSVWEINPVKVEGHPVPFPIDLAKRCILLYTRPGMTVLDPFCGSGQALIAAVRLKRKYAGFDIDEIYVNLARKRMKIASLLQQKVI